MHAFPNPASVASIEWWHVHAGNLRPVSCAGSGSSGIFFASMDAPRNGGMGESAILFFRVSRRTSIRR